MTIETNSYFQESMNDSWNPFDRIIENPDYPLARIYRRSFWANIGDTYDVIVGNHYRDRSHVGDPKTHAGFLDLLIFPLLSQWLMQIAFPEYTLIKQSPDEWNRTKWFDEKKTSGEVVTDIPGTMPLPIRILAGIFAYLLEGIRGILGAALTLLVLPIVAFVQAVTWYKASTLKALAEGLEVHCGWNRVILRDLLKGGMDLNDISMDEDEKKNPSRYVVDQYGKRERGFTLFAPANEQQIQSAEAFKELNVGAQVFR